METVGVTIQKTNGDEIVVHLKSDVASTGKDYGYRRYEAFFICT
jgi:hypothetical protein